MLLFRILHNPLPLRSPSVAPALHCQWSKLKHVGPIFSTSRCSFSSLFPQQVPQQRDASALQEDAYFKSQAAAGRARTAQQRVSKMDTVVQKLDDTLALDKAEKTRAVAKAAALEGALGKASDALELARAELSATKRRSEGYSRPRRVLSYIMSKWETEPRLEMKEAASRVDEAARVESSARAAVCTAWYAACECVEKVEITTSRLCREKLARDNAKRVYMALDAAAGCAAERARRAAGAVKAGWSWESIVYEARGTGGRMDPLLALSGFAVNFERRLGSDQVFDAIKREELCAFCFGIMISFVLLVETILSFPAELADLFVVRWHSEQTVVTNVYSSPPWYCT